MRKIKYFEEEISVDEYVRIQILKNTGANSCVYKHQLEEECEKKNIKTKSSLTK